MSESLKNSVILHEGKTYLKPLIEIIQPKRIAALGKEATASILKLYQDENENLSDRINFTMQEQFRQGSFWVNNRKTEVAPLYHPGLQGQSGRGQIETDNNKSGWELMKGDWAEITQRK